MRIVGLSCATSKQIVSAEEAYEVFGKEDVEKIVKNAGVRTRHVVDKDTTTSDLCFAAADPLLDELSWERESVDAMIFVTQTPDYILPATGYVLHEKLGASNHCFVFDVNLGCSGFTHGLLVAKGLMNGMGMNRVLLMTGDTATKPVCSQDRGAALLFGDAGMACALDNEQDEQVQGWNWGADGTGVSYLIIPAGGFRDPWSVENAQVREQPDGSLRANVHTFMDGAQIFNFTIKRVPSMITKALEMAGWATDEVDAYVFHQANKFIINYLRSKLKVSTEKVPTCLEEYGNTSSASIPQTIVTRLREQVSSQRQKLLFAGFGVGLSWSAVGMETEPFTCLPLIEI